MLIYWTWNPSDGTNRYVKCKRMNLFFDATTKNRLFRMGPLRISVSKEQHAVNRNSSPIVAQSYCRTISFMKRRNIDQVVARCDLQWYSACRFKCIPNGDRMLAFGTSGYLALQCSDPSTKQAKCIKKKKKEKEMRLPKVRHCTSSTTTLGHISTYCPCIFWHFYFRLRS